MAPNQEYDWRPRVVVDTSVLVAGIAGLKKPALSPGVNANADFIRKWAETGNFVWLYSEDVLDEYRYVLAKRGVHKAVIGKLINLLSEEGELVTVKSYPAISPHEQDNAFCACAISGEANYIVTNNTRHFPQDRIKARIVSPSCVQLKTWPAIERNPDDEELQPSEFRLFFPKPRR